MNLYRFVLAIVLDLDIGFARLNQFNCRFVMVARKTPRLAAQLCQAEWQPSPETETGAECEFRYQPRGWKREYRFVARRPKKPREKVKPGKAGEYQKTMHGPPAQRSKTLRRGVWREGSSGSRMTEQKSN